GSGVDSYVVIPNRPAKCRHGDGYWFPLRGVSPMRKFVLSILALFVCVGLTIAANVKFVKYDEDKKALTVKDGDKEKTYTVSDKTKFTNNGNGKEIANDKGIDRLKKMKADT